MSTPELQIERRGPVVSVVLNDPKTRNALSAAIFDGLGSLLESVAEDASVAAVVLSGANGFFSAGGDLNQLAANRTLEPKARMARIEKLNAMITALQTVPVPVIAAVEGGAAGAGMSLALACDLVVASCTARFTAAYVKVGLTPDGGLTASLARIVSRPVLFEICAFGAPVPADRMQALGAVHQVVNEGQALEAALVLGARFDRTPRRALARIKRLAHAAYSSPAHEQLSLEARLMVESQSDDEAAEGMAAFLEKRTPDFERLRQHGFQRSAMEMLRG